MRVSKFSAVITAMICLLVANAYSQNSWVGDSEPVYSEVYLGASDNDSKSIGIGVYVPLPTNDAITSAGELSFLYDRQKVDEMKARRFGLGFSSNRNKDYVGKIQFSNYHQDDVISESKLRLHLRRNFTDWDVTLGVNANSLDIEPDLDNSDRAECLRELVNYSNTSYGLNLSGSYHIDSWTATIRYADNDITNSFGDFEVSDFSSCFPRLEENGGEDQDSRLDAFESNFSESDERQFSGPRAGGFSSQFSTREAGLEIRWDGEKISSSVGTLYLEAILTAEESDYFYTNIKYYWSKQFNYGVLVSYDDDLESTYGELSFGTTW